MRTKIQFNFTQTLKSQFEVIPRISILYGVGDDDARGLGLDWLWFSLFVGTWGNSSVKTESEIEAAVRNYKPRKIKGKMIPNEVLPQKLTTFLVEERPKDILNIIESGIYTFIIYKTSKAARKDERDEFRLHLQSQQND